jgi:hypothetical protein
VITKLQASTGCPAIQNEKDSLNIGSSAVFLITVFLGHLSQAWVKLIQLFQKKRLKVTRLHVQTKDHRYLKENFISEYGLGNTDFNNILDYDKIITIMFYQIH